MEKQQPALDVCALAEFYTLTKAPRHEQKCGQKKKAGLRGIYLWLVRGSMLRFLCKVKVKKIFQPLIPSVKACLEHRRQYVRKNTVMAVFHAHRLFGETPIPDRPELIHNFLVSETDDEARRNTFLVLFNQSEDLAIQY